LIQISHEVPTSLLKRSEDWNDYQYALVHLFERDLAYAAYFRSYIKNGGRVILDNSLFELGTMFDSVTFAETIADFKPAEYIIPDAWEDTVSTILSVQTWSKKYKNLPGRTIGVLQGKTWRELEICYKHIAPLVDKIAVSFKPEAFGEDEANNPNFLLECGINRYAFLRHLYESSTWKTDQKPIHLLGCSLPQEFKYYWKAPFRHLIETIDTSNPVVHGILGIPYQHPNGLLIKSNIKMDSMISMNVENSINMIEANVRIFKGFVNP